MVKDIFVIKKDTMIKLFSLKQQKKDGVDISDKSGSQKKASAAQLRIQKGVYHWEI